MDSGPLNCEVKLRESPKPRRDVVRIGCGAGFAGDRPAAALKLLQKVSNMNYLVLECLAERTFATRMEAMHSGGKGYDPRILEWMSLLLPVSIKKGVCIVTNMGAMDPLGAKEEILKLAADLGVAVSVGVVYEIFCPGNVGYSTYLGAAPIVHALELRKLDVLITTRTADASLFLGPMVYELGWNWNDITELAQGTVAGHLLECGCQLTGGYYMHPVDSFRRFSPENLLDMSLPYADVWGDGKVIIAKAEGAGGELSVGTCTQQLLYEIDDPSAYITPDIIVDLRNVALSPITRNTIGLSGAQCSIKKRPEKLLRIVQEFCGWKGWGEVSYGGLCSEERAAAAKYLVYSWMEETFPGISNSILAYMIGKDSLRMQCPEGDMIPIEVRLRLDGLFTSQAQAMKLCHEVEALYTNGPAGGGGISTGFKREVTFQKELVERAQVTWTVDLSACKTLGAFEVDHVKTCSSGSDDSVWCPQGKEPEAYIFPQIASSPAKAGIRIRLYQVAHARTGDKGDILNVSIIPHFPDDIYRLHEIITPSWVKKAMREVVVDSRSNPDLCPIDATVFLLGGVRALNIVIKNALDGGVNRSRRIDRHGKTLSDLFLTQWIVMP